MLAKFAVRGLTLSYGLKPVVFSVDITVPEGSMTAIIGPNGAGKSTLLKAALGLRSAPAGTITVFGVPIAAARARIAYVPQRASVDWDFSTRVIDVVAMGLYREAGLLGRFVGRHRAKTMDAIGRVGMKDLADRQIGQLLGGHQQRVFLARALAQDADLYLLDEPFAGVDAATEKAIIAVLKELRARGKTVVGVHHDLSTASDCFDRVMLLHVRKIAEGLVEDASTADALRAAYGGRLATADVPGLALAAARRDGLTPLGDVLTADQIAEIDARRAGGARMSDAEFVPLALPPLVIGVARRPRSTRSASPELFRIAAAARLVTLLLLLFWRPLRIATCDEPYAAALGLPVTAISLGLVVVSAIAAGFVLAGCGPLWLGADNAVSAAGMIATVSGGLLGLAALFGPRRDPPVAEG